MTIDEPHCLLYLGEDYDTKIFLYENPQKKGFLIIVRNDITEKRKFIHWEIEPRYGIDVIDWDRINKTVDELLEEIRKETYV
jgi:hypothetical protein